MNIEQHVIYYKENFHPKNITLNLVGVAFVAIAMISSRPETSGSEHKHK